MGRASDDQSVFDRGEAVGCRRCVPPSLTRSVRQAVQSAETRGASRADCLGHPSMEPIQTLRNPKGFPCPSKRALTCLISPPLTNYI